MRITQKHLKDSYIWWIKKLKAEKEFLVGRMHCQLYDIKNLEVQGRSLHVFCKINKNKKEKEKEKDQGSAKKFNELS